MAANFVDSPLVVRSPQMRALVNDVARVAHESGPVLIEGESATGKELLARQIHSAGPRAAGPFVPVDCCVSRDPLFEEQLFGCVKGASCGTTESILGFIRAAHGGTLFLHDVAALPRGFQGRLLRCIQDRAVAPLGGNHPVPVDVRILAAAEADLSEAVAAGAFRQDLFDHLAAVRLELPPLRARREDIVPLAEYFLGALADFYNGPPKELSPGTIDLLTSYCWPGNVRELARVMERAYLLSANAHIDDCVLSACFQDAESESDEQPSRPAS